MYLKRRDPLTLAELDDIQAHFNTRSPVGSMPLGALLCLPDNFDHLLSFLPPNDHFNETRAALFSEDFFQGILQAEDSDETDLIPNTIIN